jgi:germination protein M
VSISCDAIVTGDGHAVRLGIVCSAKRPTRREAQRRPAMKTTRSRRLLAASFLCSCLLAACASAPTRPLVALPGQATASEPVASANGPGSEETIALSVYFLMHDPRAIDFVVPVQRMVPLTDDATAAAIRELLAGPTAVEQLGNYLGRRGPLARLSTAIPSGTQLRGIVIQNGVATIDLSGDFGSGGSQAAYRQAQIVYTLTQFPTVNSVGFRLDGKPMNAIEGHEGIALSVPATRQRYFDQRRSVFIDQPAWRAAIGDTLLVTGETDLEAGIRYALVNGATDRVLAEQTVEASCHPCMVPDAWGRFEVRLPMPAGPRPSDLRLRVWEPPSTEGGSATVVDYPVS